MIHPPGCDCPAYACRLRRKNVQVSEAAIPNRVANRKPKVLTEDDFAKAPSWEKGLAQAQQTPDGSTVPVYNEKGEPLRVKEYSERRREIDAKLHHLRGGGGLPSDP